MKKYFFVLFLFFANTSLNSQCIVKLTSDKQTLCTNQTATITATSSELSFLNDFTSQKRLFEIQSLKLDQSIQSLINSGIIQGLTFPFDQFIDNVVLDMPNIKLQNTLISSGKLEVTILTDLIQDNKIIFEFPYIKRNNISIKDSILFDGKTLAVGQNSITKTIDLSGTSIDFSVGNSSTFNTIQYKANSTLKISTTKFTGNEVGDIKISLKDIKYLTNTTFKWYKDGILIPNQNTSSLLINEPAKYTVNTSSNCGNFSDYIIINANTNLKVNVLPNRDTLICAGQFVNLNATQSANFTYQWYNNDQLIKDATSFTYKAMSSGKYSVKVSDLQCTALSNTVNVIVNNYPSNLVKLSGSTTLCQGDKVTLSAYSKGSYLWSNGEKTQSIIVDQKGTYSVLVTENGCTSTSDQISISVNPLPTVSITPQGKTTFCEGGSVVLLANGGTNYQWNTGSTNPSLTVSQSGTYEVTAFNDYGCKSLISQTVTVNSLPEILWNELSQITFKNTKPIQLIAKPIGGSFSGEGVKGTTFDPTLTTLGNKKITYTFTSPQGCTSVMSKNTLIVDTLGNICNVTKYDTVKVNKTIFDTVQINDTVSVLKIKFLLSTGIKANQYTSMNVYPNPTADVLIIDANDLLALKDYRYVIYDSQVKEVYNAFITNAKTEISLNSLGSKGMYVLHIVDANNESVQTKQIVLE